MNKVKKTSVRGKLVSELIEDITATSYGKQISNGHVYQDPKEPKWIWPITYENEEVQMDNFKMEFLHPKIIKNNRVILQLHGGGYIGVLRNAYRRLALQYAKRLGGGYVLSPDYRVAPQHIFPCALEDAVASYKWLLEEKGFKPEQIVVAGDSAGGGLALALGLYLKEHGMPLPLGFILMSPWTDLSLSGKSLTENFHADPLFGGSTENMIFDTSYRGEEDPKNPYLSPLFGDVKGFPPMLFQAGGNEMLLDDTVRMARKAKKDKVKVRCSVYPGMFHVFQMALGLIPESREAWEEVGSFLKVIDKYR